MVPSDPTYVLVVSGLEIGGVRNQVPVQMLIDFITGHLGAAADVSEAARISRVIVAGNSRVPLEDPNILLERHVAKEVSAFPSPPCPVPCPRLLVLPVSPSLGLPD